MRGKEMVEVKQPKAKIIIAVIFLLALLVAYVIAQTTLMRIYEVNVVVNFFESNTVNIIFIALVLITINVLEIRTNRKKLEDIG